MTLTFIASSEGANFEQCNVYRQFQVACPMNIKRDKQPEIDSTTVVQTFSC